LNDKEIKVMTALRKFRNGTILSELAKEAFPRQSKAQGNSWVRNCLRRLVRAGFVQKVDRGTYKATPKGLSGEPSFDAVVPADERANQTVSNQERGSQKSLQNGQLERSLGDQPSSRLSDLQNDPQNDSQTELQRSRVEQQSVQSSDLQKSNLQPEKQENRQNDLKQPAGSDSA
jgi:hypothetical protein